jgi:DNA primase
MAEPRDHVLMTLAIKPRGKLVDLEHIREKVSRDAGREFSGEEVGKLLEELEEEGLVGREGEGYALTERGREHFERRWREVREELNQDYLKVYRAKKYYPVVAPTLLEFCRDRWVSVFRLFTGRAWLQRKVGNRYITIRSLRDLERWLDLHGIDFIPYIHPRGSDRPDWFVLDLDAGKEVPEGEVRRVVATTLRVMEEFGLEPKLKYSGSRGFQLWTRFKPHDLPEGYRPLELQSGGRERNLFSFYADLIRFLEYRVSLKLPGLTTCDVAHKERRRGKVLFDPSVMKPMGDVRAPYSMHHRTGLISMPLEGKELGSFRPEQADPERVAERYRERGNEFELRPVEGEVFFGEALEWFRESPGGRKE